MPCTLLSAPSANCQDLHHRNQSKTTDSGADGLGEIAHRQLEGRHTGMSSPVRHLSTRPSCCFHPLSLGGSLQIWRDAYTLACLLTAAAKLHPQQGSDSAGAKGSAMRDLDLAVMMGGPRFRTQADELIAALHSALKVPAKAVSRGSKPPTASRQGLRQRDFRLAQRLPQCSCCFVSMG